ncbi:cytochrome c [Arhodomonas sp. KWT2]
MAPPAGDGGTPGDHPQGRRIAQDGLWEQGVPACTTCHGPDGRGVGSVFPPLAGQHANYLRNQIEAWQSGDRHDDPHGLMASVAGRLEADQAAAVAEYFAALPATRQ